MMKSFTIYDRDLDPFIRAHLYAALSDGFIPYWVAVKIDGHFVRYEKNVRERSVTFYYEDESDDI